MQWYMSPHNNHIVPESPALSRLLLPAQWHVAGEHLVMDEETCTRVVGVSDDAPALQLVAHMRV